MHWLTKDAYLVLSSVFPELLSSLPVLFSAYPKFTLTPMSRKMTKLFYIALTLLCLFCLRFALQYNTKFGLKSHLNPLKKMYQMHTKFFIYKFGMYIPVGNTGCDCNQFDQ